MAGVDDEHMRELRETWTSIFGEAQTATYRGDEYQNVLRDANRQLQGCCDHDGQPLLELAATQAQGRTE